MLSICCGQDGAIANKKCLHLLCSCYTTNQVQHGEGVSLRKARGHRVTFATLGLRGPVFLRQKPDDSSRWQRDPVR